MLPFRILVCGYLLLWIVYMCVCVFIYVMIMFAEPWEEADVLYPL